MLVTERPRDVHVPTLHSHLIMSDARSNPLDLTGAHARRFPRLAVRNRSPVVVTESAWSSGQSNSEAPSRTDAGRPGASHSRQNSTQSLQPDHQHRRRQSKAVNVVELQQSGRQAAKKKSAGVLGFLTLKEPSTSALEDFAEQERRKAAQKNLKSDGVILPGVSSQKLPDHVPKVNSKWDGLPDSTKRKFDKDRERERERAKRSSVTSFASNISGDAPRRSYGSLSSKPAVRQSEDKTRVTAGEGQVTSGRRDDSVTSRLSSTMSSVTIPALGHTQGQLSVDMRAQRALHPPTPPSALRLDSQDDAFEFDLPDVPNIQERDYTSGSATSPEASPRTPAFDAVSPTLNHSTRAQSPALLISTSPHGYGNFWTTDCETVVGQVPGIDILSPPATLSEKASGRSLSSHMGATMPAIQEAASTNDGVSVVDNTVVRNISRPSRGSETPGSAPTQKVNPAAAVKPSEKNEVLPWEMFEPPMESIKHTKVASESGRLKRFSKLGRK